jgi:aldehyde dehydrogenase (NAD+)
MTEKPKSSEIVSSPNDPLQWDYVTSREAADLVAIEDRYGVFVDGEFKPPLSKKWFETINPASEETLAEAPLAGPKDVDRAVKAARKAAEPWAKLAPSERAKYLFRIARMVQERSRELAVLETLDGGKPIREARDVDLPLVAAHFFYHAGWADKLGYAFPGATPSPLGVVGQVIPWNFPLLMMAWKVAPALATGNTVVLKPAETTPLSALHFAQIAAEAGLPPGVLNVVPGAGETGAAVVAHDDIDKVAFTGSTEVGKMIRRSIAGSSKRLTLELGGKGAHVVFDDAPLDQAVEGVVNGIFFNQGHVCCAGSRLLVQESVADVFLDKLRRRLSTLRVGDPLDKNTDVGAINSAEQLARINELVDAGVAEGAEMFQPSCVLPDRGFFFTPTLFTDVSQSHRIAQEEIFGPVLSAMTFRTPDEAVEKANNTPYGLAAGVWTTKGSRILWMADRLRSGVVWANTYNKFDPASPFGGYKESGFGREGGRHGLLAYMHLEGTI